MMKRNNFFIYLAFVSLFVSCKNELEINSKEKVNIYSIYIENKLDEIKDIDLLVAEKQKIYKKFTINNRDDSRKSLKYNSVNNCIIFIVEANVVDKIEWIPKVKSKVNNKLTLDACMKNDEIKIGTQNVFYIVSIYLFPFPKGNLDIKLDFCE